MFTTIYKKLQQHQFAHTWKQSLKNKQIVKNSFLTHGNIKKAKIFVHSVQKYTPHTHFVEHGEHIIFSSDMLIAPAYVL